MPEFSLGPHGISRQGRVRARPRHAEDWQLEGRRERPPAPLCSLRVPTARDLPRTSQRAGPGWPRRPRPVTTPEGRGVDLWAEPDRGVAQQSFRPRLRREVEEEKTGSFSASARLRALFSPALGYVS